MSQKLFDWSQWILRVYFLFANGLFRFVVSVYGTIRNVGQKKVLSAGAFNPYGLLSVCTEPFGVMRIDGIRLLDAFESNVDCWNPFLDVCVETLEVALVVVELHVPGLELSHLFYFTELLQWAPFTPAIKYAHFLPSCCCQEWQEQRGFPKQ